MEQPVPMLQSPLGFETPPGPPPLSGVPPHFLLVLVSALLPGPCFFRPRLSGAPPKPSQMYSPWIWRRVCRILSPTAFPGGRRRLQGPKHLAPGGGELRPVLAAGRGTASDWHVPPPGTPAWGGWKEESKEREGGEREKEGRGSWREASGSVWGWTRSWSVPPPPLGHLI